jgi:uncharacterized repeat protein (TIGR03803 family)
MAVVDMKEPRPSKAKNSPSVFPESAVIFEAIQQPTKSCKSSMKPAKFLAETGERKCVGSTAARDMKMIAICGPKVEGRLCVFMGVFVAAVSGAFPVAAGGAPLTTLYSFGVAANGSEPEGTLVVGGDGALYGTTAAGGVNGVGSIFRITTNGTFTSLYSFGQSREITNDVPLDGATLETGLVLASNGVLYGTTDYGGINNEGVAFSITTNVAFTNLCSFAIPSLGLNYNYVTLGVDGDFYGTSSLGGTNGAGAIFRMTPQGMQTPLVSFPSDSYPNDLTAGTYGDLYGTSWGPGEGSIFKISTNGEVTGLYSFSGSDGSHPWAKLTRGNDGALYGTTLQGGDSNQGVAFKITPNGDFSLLYSFTGGDDGSEILAPMVVGADGNLYGTSTQGGTNGQGGIYKLSTNGGTVTPFYSFPGGGGGAFPQGGLAAPPDGNLYGTTTHGGAYNNGMIFRITLEGVLTQLYSFGPEPAGVLPQGRLTLGNDGNYYGTAAYSAGSAGGGAFFEGRGYGGVFKVSPSGASSVLYSFTNGSDGGVPIAGLTLGTDGNFYGVTSQGGTSNYGTFIKINPTGSLTTLYSFTGTNDGANPDGDLAADGTGNFYGTAYNGGASGYGSVFITDANGALMPLYSFTGEADGANPFAGLILGGDGNFYGSTTYGAAENAGTIFKITPGGGLTTLHSFSGSDGAYPFASLTQGNDGDLYGTTVQGGAYNAGVIFKITTNGAFTLLNQMDGSAGGFPFGQLLQASDGNFYGTASLLGVSPDSYYPHPAEWNGDGTIFQITGEGVFSLVYAFGQALNPTVAPLDGINPYAGLVQGRGGKLYGTTYGGGSADAGSVFQITLPPPPAPIFQGVSNSGAMTTLTWSASWGAKYQLQYTENLDSTNWINLGPILTTTNTSITTTDSGGSAERFYRVYIPW